jgi:predicted transcriptional regulator
MRRTSIYLDDRQQRTLDQIGQRTRRTISELIREATDAQYGTTAESDFVEALRAGA